MRAELTRVASWSNGRVDSDCRAGVGRSGRSDWFPRRVCRLRLGSAIRLSHLWGVVLLSRLRNRWDVENRGTEGFRSGVVIADAVD